MASHHDRAARCRHATDLGVSSYPLGLHGHGEDQQRRRSHTFTPSIEGHAGIISNATNSTYMDQKKFDPADTSQDYVAAWANGDPDPTKAKVTGIDRVTADIAASQNGGWNLR